MIVCVCVCVIRAFALTVLPTCNQLQFHILVSVVFFLLSAKTGMLVYIQFAVHSWRWDIRLWYELKLGTIFVHSNTNWSSLFQLTSRTKKKRGDGNTHTIYVKKKNMQTFMDCVLSRICTFFHWVLLLLYTMICLDTQHASPSDIQLKCISLINCVQIISVIFRSFLGN